MIGTAVELTLDNVVMETDTAAPSRCPQSMDDNLEKVFMEEVVATPAITEELCIVKRAADFPVFFNANNLLSRLLTPHIYDLYHSVKTPAGVSFNDIMQAGVDNPRHPYIKSIGVYAGDEVSERVFSCG